MAEIGIAVAAMVLFCVLVFGIARGTAAWMGGTVRWRRRRRK